MNPEPVDLGRLVSAMALYFEAEANRAPVGVYACILGIAVVTLSGLLMCVVLVRTWVEGMRLRSKLFENQHVIRRAICGRPHEDGNGGDDA